MPSKVLSARFWRNANGREPVRDWLKELPEADRRTIGTDIKAAEYGWPLGLPLCRHLQDEIWEVRSTLASNRIARVLFCTVGDNMVLLHGFVKKTQTTPKKELDLALARVREKDTWAQAETSAARSTTSSRKKVSSRPARRPPRRRS